MLTSTPRPKPLDPVTSPYTRSSPIIRDCICMASSSHEDHADLDSLFGDAEYQDGFESEPQVTHKRSMIQFPRAAVLSQNS
ncbi:hypothetical protein OPQ81_001723 [Rhizoctonia solani]|nr:hypothetical protein OPQ81_001723 [Rhizoctonia solani]